MQLSTLVDITQEAGGYLMPNRAVTIPSRVVPANVRAGARRRATTPSARAARSRVRRFILALSSTTWVCLDVLLIALAALGAHVILPRMGTNYAWMTKPWLASTAFSVCIPLAGLVFGLYERPTLLSRGRILFRSLMTLALGTGLAFACLSVFLYAHLSQWTGLAVCITYLLVAVPVRLVTHEVLTRSRVRVLCVGGAAGARRLARLLADLRGRHYCVVGHVPLERAGDRAEECFGQGVAGHEGPALVTSVAVGEQSCRRLGTAADLRRVVAEHGVDEVVVSGELTGHPALGRIVATCLEQGCRVTDQATLIEKLMGEVPADSITAEWFLRADVQNHGTYDAGKRIMDILVALVGLLVSLPLWPLIALAIWIESGRPLLFTQLRVGQFGRLFTIYKFRTMWSNAEQGGARWAAAKDERVTRVGRILRRSRLDELPQLVNILLGDMSLVGPRPERPVFVRQLEQLLPHYRLRHLVKPGLTGWAQIHYGYGASVADAHRKLCYDLYYLKHRSLDLDLAILIRTFGTFVLGAR
jgi:exopolysaccharide biosynthesis polyprenyl glycosylphosphotransferase